MITNFVDNDVEIIKKVTCSNFQKTNSLNFEKIDLAEYIKLIKTGKFNEKIGFTDNLQNNPKGGCGKINYEIKNKFTYDSNHSINIINIKNN